MASKILSDFVIIMRESAYLTPPRKQTCVAPQVGCGV